MKDSVSLVTNKVYSIPEELDDSVAIDSFISKHSDKKIVVVQGLGFVGAVMSLVCANALTEEYAVIGIDLPSPNSYWKIQEINEGVFPIISSDKKVGEFYENALKKGNLLATYDSYAYSKADAVVVDINLDVAKESGHENELLSFDVDLSSFKKAVTAIGDNCKEDVLILVETTVPPGTCQHVVQPIIEDCFDRRGLNKKYKIGHSYERVMPGPNYIDSIQNFYRVFSGINEESEVAVETFLRTIISTENYPLTKLGSTNATEMAKVLENSYRAMNIAFAEEWGEFAEEAGVNMYEVVSAIRMRPTHQNLMLPGLGVGGYCLTKDPLLASWAKQNIFNSSKGLSQSETAVKINDQMPLHAFKVVQKLFGDFQGKKILLLGVSYLNDVGDTRYTPVELLYDKLKEGGADIALHDPYVSFWEEKSLEVQQDLDISFKNHYDCIIVTTMHKEYRESPKLLQYLEQNSSTTIVDTWGVINLEKVRELLNTIRVLGRGDI